MQFQFVGGSLFYNTSKYKMCHDFVLNFNLGSLHIWDTRPSEYFDGRIIIINNNNKTTQTSNCLKQKSLNVVESVTKNRRI